MLDEISLKIDMHVMQTEASVIFPTYFTSWVYVFFIYD